MAGRRGHAFRGLSGRSRHAYALAASTRGGRRTGDELGAARAEAKALGPLDPQQDRASDQLPWRVGGRLDSLELTGVANAAGLYLLLEDRELVYVGETRNLRGRLGSHRRVLPAADGSMVPNGSARAAATTARDGDRSHRRFLRALRTCPEPSVRSDAETAENVRLAQHSPSPAASSAATALSASRCICCTVGTAVGPPRSSAATRNLRTSICSLAWATAGFIG